MTGGFLPSDYSGTAPNSGGGNAPTFIFPLLKNAEIIQCLQELNVNELTERELAEPHRHKDKVKKAYWMLLDICHGVTEEDVLQRIQSSSDEAPAELHKDGIVDVLFFREMQQLMKTCGWFDFSWRDVHSPTSKRLRIILSAIMNMARFREDQLRKYMELNEPREQLVSTLNEITREQEQLQTDFAAVQEKASSDSVVRDELAQECQRLEMEIARNNKLQSSQREQAEQLKKQISAMQDELAASEWAFQEAQVEEESLRSKIVSSPNRRQAELDTKRSALEERKVENRSLQETLDEHKKRAMIVEQVAASVEASLEIQAQVQDEATKYEQAIGQVHTTMKQVNEYEQRTATMTESSTEAERKAMRVEEKLSKEREQSKIRLQALHDALETAKAEFIAVEQERRDGLAEIETRERRIQELQHAIRQFEQRAIEEVDAIKKEYQEAEQAFLVRNQRRLKAIGVA